jgi:lysine-specific demethylase 8
MDATLLLVAIALASANPTQQGMLLELVRKLDTANIVTAYFAHGRREAFFELLKRVQQRISTTFPVVSDHQSQPRPTKRRKIDAPTPTKPNYPLLPHIAEIKRYTLDTAPTFEDLPYNSSEPFIITAGVSHWPALSDPSTNWKDEEYLLRVAGKGRIVPVEIGKSYTAQGWTQKMVPFEDFLNKINWSDDDFEKKGDQQPMYLAQHDLFQQFPALLADIVPPDYVFSDLAPPDHFKEYTPPNVDAGYTINAWMGPRGTYSPAHTDPYYNCYGTYVSLFSIQTKYGQAAKADLNFLFWGCFGVFCVCTAQVVGAKHIWVAPPDCSDLLLFRISASPSPEDSTTSEHHHNEEQGNQYPNGNGHEESNSAAQQFMDNTTTIDVFELAKTTYPHALAQEPEDANDKPQDPSLLMMQKAMQAVLQEGDLLFMPPK